MAPIARCPDQPGSFHTSQDMESTVTALRKHCLSV